MPRRKVEQEKLRAVSRFIAWRENDCLLNRSQRFVNQTDFARSNRECTVRDSRIKLKHNRSAAYFHCAIDVSGALVSSRQVDERLGGPGVERDGAAQRC